MACNPHPKVISPCADDGVSVGQVLGTRGDIAYDEQGSVALTIGQTSVSVEFSFTKESDGYVFEYLYIKTEDESPVDIRPVPRLQTKRGFTCELTGMPITANSVLYWRVVVPDPLHTCQGLVTGPQYAQVLDAQEGIEPLISGQSYVEVEFPTAQPDANWKFECLVIEFEEIADHPARGFVMTPTVHTAQGFTVQLSGAPENGLYRLHWRVRALA